jgi:hypothetical protein
MQSGGKKTPTLPAGLQLRILSERLVQRLGGSIDR